MARSTLATKLGTASAVAATLVVIALGLRHFEESRPAAGSTEGPRVWRFLEDLSDPALIGFKTGAERSGAWVLGALEDATGERALINLAGAPDEGPAMAVVGDLAPRDVLVTTRCRASSALPEQSCGVVFRHHDDRTHYVARIDAVAGTAMLGVVIDDTERPIEVQPVTLEPAAWHELGVQARADHLVVFVNGEKVIEAHDPTLPHAGAVGLWVPSDGVAFFDELTIDPLTSTLPHPSELLPFLLKRL